MAVEAPVPPLSIIVVSFNDATLLERCLTSLAAQAANHGAEVIVVRAARDDDAAVTSLRERTTHVTWIRGDADETIPRLRGRGLLAARGPIVGLLEDATKYFTIHHTPADTVDRIEPAEVSRAAAAIAAVAYVVADMPQKLPKM